MVRVRITGIVRDGVAATLFINQDAAVIIQITGRVHNTISV